MGSGIACHFANAGFQVIMLDLPGSGENQRRNQVAEDALAFAISNGVNDADSILAAYRSLTSQVQQLQPMQLNADILSMPSFATNNARYDDLFRQEVCSL